MPRRGRRFGPRARLPPESTWRIPEMMTFLIFEGQRRSGYIGDMPFTVVPNQSDVGRAVIPGVYLVHSSWNDWWKYETLYSLFLVVTPGAVVHAGSVKIGQQGM